MIRIVFDNGEILDCENVERIFFEEKDWDYLDARKKITVVGHLNQYTMKDGQIQLVMKEDKA